MLMLTLYALVDSMDLVTSALEVSRRIESTCFAIIIAAFASSSIASLGG